MRKLLVFGTGFLVKHITELFAKSNCDVIVVYNKHKVPELKEDKQFQKDEINTAELIINYQPDYILFSVGDSFVTANVDIGYAINKNLMDTLNVLEDIYSNNIEFIKKIVIIGSAAEYGKNSFAMPETTQTHPSSIYGLTKIFLYNTSMYYVGKGLPIVYVLQFNSIGPYQRDCFVLSSFSKQIAQIETGNQEPVITVGDLSSERDFIDVRDTAVAYKLLFENGKIGETYNIGSGVSIATEKLLDILLENTTYKSKIDIVHEEINSLKKNSLSNKLLSDNTKLLQLGFKTKLTITQTVIDTLNYWRKNV